MCRGIERRNLFSVYEKKKKIPKMKASSKKSHRVAGKSIRRKRLICSFAAADNEGAGHADSQTSFEGERLK